MGINTHEQTKLSSDYAAHLSPWKGEKERGLLIPN